MGLILGADAGGGIAAQGYDAFDAGIPVVLEHLVDLALGGGDAGDVAGGLEACLLRHALDDGGCAFTRRAAGAIGDGDVGRVQRLKTAHGIPELLLHVGRLGREELEGYARRFHAADLLPVLFASFCDSAVQTVTATPLSPP